MKVLCTFLYEDEYGEILVEGFELNYSVPLNIDRSILKEILELEIRERYGIEPVEVLFEFLYPNRRFFGYV